MLAKAMGWDTANMTDTVVMIDTPEGKPFFSFYNPANMHLAWQVHAWAMQYWAVTYRKWCDEINLLVFSDPQSLFLDKILELAIEAGILKLEE